MNCRWRHPAESNPVATNCCSCGYPFYLIADHGRSGSGAGRAPHCPGDRQRRLPGCAASQPRQRCPRDEPASRQARVSCHQPGERRAGCDAESHPRVRDQPQRGNNRAFLLRGSRHAVTRTQLPAARRRRYRQRARPEIRGPGRADDTRGDAVRRKPHEHRHTRRVPKQPLRKAVSRRLQGPRGHRRGTRSPHRLCHGARGGGGGRRRKQRPVHIRAAERPRGAQPQGRGGVQAGTCRGHRSNQRCPGAVGVFLAHR